MRPDGLRRAFGSVAVGAIVVLLVVGGLYALGATHPPRRPAVTTDRLGPTGGESVAAYIAAASAGVARATGTRWALVSPRAPLDDDTAWSLIAGTGPSQVAFHVTVDAVATPTTFEPLTRDGGSLRTARDLAVDEIARTVGPDAVGRDGQIAALVRSRLTAGCACVVALVVRGDADRLRALAADRRVRAVEVLPADAGGRFVVHALLPEQSDRVGPLPDTAPVPSS
ncbi:hypothetical protein ACQ7HM_16885 [Williamsia sp. MIQD14]|uniref:hypothetical protein n=1 Tax=Williamsia sp. MIQD14 TaxID=3425703 RepID=UPI003DA0A044